MLNPKSFAAEIIIFFLFITFTNVKAQQNKIHHYNCQFDIQTDGCVDATISISYTAYEKKTSGFKKFVFAGEIDKNSVEVIDTSGIKIEYWLYNEGDYQIIKFNHPPFVGENIFVMNFKVKNTIEKKFDTYCLKLDNIGTFGIQVEKASYFIKFPENMIVNNTKIQCSGSHELSKLNKQYIIKINEENYISNDLNIDFKVSDKGIVFAFAKHNIISYEVFILLLFIGLTIGIYFFYKKYKTIQSRFNAVCFSGTVLSIFFFKTYLILIPAIVIYFLLLSFTRPDSMDKINSGKRRSKRNDGGFFGGCGSGGCGGGGCGGGGCGGGGCGG